jgi:hypothetical protein
MASLKRRLMAVVAIAAGIFTLRTLRRRRSETTHVDTIHGGREEHGTAAEHAAAATEHARIATKKAVSMKNK